MRPATALLVLTCLFLGAWGCEPEQYHNGCMIVGNTCKCGYGCNTEYIYKTRRSCRNALRNLERPSAYGNTVGYGNSNGGYGSAWERESPIPLLTPSAPRSSNICSNMVCVRGICIQTTNEPGYTCKCEGTGFYGQRCEKACPTMPIRGMVFPHECVVI